MGEEKLFTKLEFPFTNANQIATLDQLSAKVMEQAMKNKWMATAMEISHPFPLMKCQRPIWMIISRSPTQKGLIEKTHSGKICQGER